MRVERPTWGTTLAGVAVVGLGVAAARPLLVLAGVPLAAWVVGRQASALSTFRAVDDRLTVDVTTTRQAVSVEEDVRVTVAARVDGGAPAPLSVTVPLPVGATGASRAERTIQLDPGETDAGTSFACSFPTAGRYTFPNASVDISPEDGLFSETLPCGTRPTVQVRPRAPTDLHVGRGGESLALSYGEHPAGRGGGGLSPEELRQYQPGDAADRIDWKATARHQGLYVREYEAESDRRTALVVDHRSATDLGPAGETVFAYLREVALGFTDGAAALSDPLSCWTVGDDGITGRLPAASTESGYERIRTHLRGLSPTAPDPTPVDSAAVTNGEATAGDAAGADGIESGARPAERSGSPRQGAAPLLRPSAAAVRLDRLSGDDSAFASRLRPFFGARESYVQRLQGDALFAAIEQIRGRRASSTLSVILTDDSDREAIREAVRLATRGDDHAFVFLAPRLLFSQETLADVERGYETYLEFEKFRRSLDGLPRVTAFEVGPGDRLDRLLEVRRR